MKGTFAACAVLAAGASAAAVEKRANSTAAATTSITVKGNAFFQGEDRFYIRGVDYQPGGSSANKDPIADAAGCQRDVQKFKELGINTIRVYSVDNSANHDECMKALADAGIYLALDVNTPFYSLNRKDEESIQRSYNDVYLQSIFATVDVFAKYDNTLLFYSANEVINDEATSFAAPYVKAVTRDLRAYIKSRGYRSIPVGYSAADVEVNRFQMAQYMNCGPDEVRSDFFAFNDYSWCDPSTFQTSGWDKKVKQYANYGIPIFLSEFGCNTNTRAFGEVASLYSTDMTSVYSGGLVYEYSQEEANYGLVTISGDSVSERPDFKALKDAYSKTSPPQGDGGYKSAGAKSECPPAAPPAWVVTDQQLPAIPEPAKKYFQDGAGAGPGNKGNTGSQNAGTATTGKGDNNNVGVSTSSKAAAANVRIPELSMTPVIAGLTVLLSTFVGMML